jgi:hypothetical protein
MSQDRKYMARYELEIFSVPAGMPGTTALENIHTASYCSSGWFRGAEVDAHALADLSREVQEAFDRFLKKLPSKGM